MEHEIPNRLGRYRLVERIAAGGMAELYRAKLVGASGFERTVAVKCIRPEYARDEQFVWMFIDEAKIAVQLSHPHIAQVFELGREGDVYFIAQEFVHGKDLRAIWKAERRRGGRIPLPITIYLIRSVCEALHYAHRAVSVDGERLGVVHRDISPQNILLSYEGEVKVVDFGLARAKGRLTRTAAGVVKGKLAYLAPEQAHGGSMDHRVDLFALGIVCWELITGERLFRRDSDVETIRAVREGEVPALRRFVPDVPVALERIVSRALQRDPKDRFQDAAEMLEAFEALAVSAGWMVGRREAADYLRALLPPPPRRSEPSLRAPGAPARVADEPPTACGRPSTPRVAPVSEEPPTLLERSRPPSLAADASGGVRDGAPPPQQASTLRMEVPSSLLARARGDVTVEVSLQEMEEPTGTSLPGCEAAPGAEVEQAPTVLDLDVPESVRAAVARWRGEAEGDAVQQEPVPADTVEEVLPEGLRTVPGAPLPAEAWVEEPNSPGASTAAHRQGPPERGEEPGTEPSAEPPVLSEGGAGVSDASAVPSSAAPRSTVSRAVTSRRASWRSRSLVLGEAKPADRKLPRGRVIRTEED